MAGGPGTPELVAAVTRAGGLGTVGAAGMTPERVREAVARALELAGPPVAVNVQLASPGPGTAEPYAVHAVLDRLIAYLPDVIHIVIISREIPPLTLARLRSQDSLSFIDRDDLLFTNEETQELFRKVFGLMLTTEVMVTKVDEDEPKNKVAGAIR